MAAIFNFLGVLVMTLINKKVAETIYNMVDFGGDAHEALVAPVRGDGGHRHLGHGGVEVRHPHQREPRAHRRPVRRGHRPAQRHVRHHYTYIY